MFIEPDKPAPDWLALVLIGLLVTLPMLGLSELSEAEGSNILMAREMVAGGDFINTTVLGAPVVMAPLPAWILAVANLVIPLKEFGVRLALGVIPLGILVYLCVAFGRDIAGHRAGIAAGAAALTSAIAIQIGLEGTGEMVFAVLINSCWFAWFRWCREKRWWLGGWFVCHLLLALAVLAGGPKAIIFFYLPLLLLRRPLRARQRLFRPAHLLSLACILFLGGLWVGMQPTLLANIGQYVREFTAQQIEGSYLHRLALFPVVAIGYYMPWCMLVWPSWCRAFRRLERNPVCCKYLRTIICSVFVLYWLMPEGKAERLLPLIGPLSVLVASNYDILVRRHGRPLLNISWCLCLLAVTAAAVGIVSLIHMVHAGSIDTGLSLPVRAAIGGGTGVALVLAVLVIIQNKTITVWTSVCGAAVALHLLWSSGEGIHQHVTATPVRKMIRSLQEPLPETAEVYAIFPTGATLTSACVYLGRPVTRIQSVSELPPFVDNVYLLSRDLAPNPIDWEWTACSDPATVGAYRHQLWKGTRR